MGVRNDNLNILAILEPNVTLSSPDCDKWQSGGVCGFVAVFSLFRITCMQLLLPRLGLHKNYVTNVTLPV